MARFSDVTDDFVRAALAFYGARRARNSELMHAIVIQVIRNQDGDVGSQAHRAATAQALVGLVADELLARHAEQNEVGEEDVLMEMLAELGQVNGVELGVVEGGLNGDGD